MNLYQKLFGLNCMRPADDGDTGGAGGGDRGDNWVPETAATTATTAAQETVDDDLKVATGTEGEEKDEDGQPRDAGGKFAKKDKEDGPSIPKARFDSAVAKERERAEAAERALAELQQAQKQVARGADITALEQQVRELRAAERKALISGEDDKAEQYQAEADRLNRQIAIEQARDMSAQAKEQAREEIRWDMTLERIETEYPALDEKSEEFDQDLTDDVVDKMNGYMTRDRMPRSQALLKAVQYVTSRRAAPSEVDTTEKKGLDRLPALKDRKGAAVAKNLDAAARQPASTKKVGADSDKHGQTGAVPEANDMTYEEFSALPETTKAKMRGDFVA